MQENSGRQIRREIKRGQLGEKVGKKLGKKVGEKTGEKVGESLGEIHKLNLGIQVQKVANIGFFGLKPYLKGVDRDFLFDRKFCLVEILKR